MSLPVAAAPGEGRQHVQVICNKLGITELLKLEKTSKIKSNSQPSPTTMVTTKPLECICLKPRVQH